jgi:hypothetical protein
MNAETKVKKAGRAPSGQAGRASPGAAKASPPSGDHSSRDDPKPSIYERLAAEFPRSAIHWRSQNLTQSGNKALALAYLDARDVQDRLDQVCTPAGWRNTITETPSGRVICTIEIKIDGEWIGKTDGAGNTAVEGDKGGISDAFKRSAVLWGVGRYLYRLPQVWAPCESVERPQGSGKRYFKKWIGTPWDQVPNTWKAATYSDAPDHDPITGEVADLKGPEGISGIKERLRALKQAGNEAETLEEFNDLVRAAKDDLTVIRDDNHDWWAGDGVEDEGFKGWIVRRRQELAGSLQFRFLISLIDECDTVAALQNLVTQHGDAIDALDGAESRRFQTRFDEREAGLAAVAKVTEGA